MHLRICRPMWVFASWLVFSASLPAAVRLPRVFGDHMVLQQGQPVPVWGWAGPDEPVAVAFAGQVKTTRAGADGRWRVQFDPLTSSYEPADLTVTGSDTRVLKDVLVGEVWLCSGQSNMDNVLREENVFDAAAEIAAATNSAIRQFRVKVYGAYRPRDDAEGGVWTVCSPHTASGFTAAGYFFARALERELKAPVGLINGSAGGTPIEQWINAEGYRQVPSLARHVPVFEAWEVGTDTGRKAYGEYIARMKAWLPAAEAALAAGRILPARPASPTESAPTVTPTTLFNGIIHPVIPYAIRGVLWYQGEEALGATYLDRLKALVGGWRAAWGAGELPFHIVQLPNYQTGGADPNDPAGDSGYARVREAQMRAAAAIPNTGFIVTIDIGESNNIHPRNKQDVGARLARRALADTYGRALASCGPVYKRFEIEPGRIRVFFAHAEGGLMAGEKNGLEPVREVPGGALRWFAVAGADRVWRWADATMDGETVLVSSADITAPVAVRYAFTADPTGVFLYSREGLPASPFRTDDWK